MSIGRQKKIILGIDPGLADTGYGIISEEKGKITLLTCGSIKTPARVPLTKRLEIIAREKKIIKDYQPDKAGIEQLFFGNNAKTAIAVGQARGVALQSLANIRPSSNTLGFKSSRPSLAAAKPIKTNSTNG